MVIGLLLLCAATGDGLGLGVSRRRALLRVASASAALPALATSAAPAKKYSVRDAQEAIGAIKAARRDLDALDALVAAGAYEDAAAALAAPPISTFEAAATAIVSAPVLPAEEKRAIGTIRRYGCAADVIIMTGGLREALENADRRGAASYLAKAKGSLDEVIATARDGGLR